ncbi:SRPBCC family protein [Glycomyces tarimensis]
MTTSTAYRYSLTADIDAPVAKVWQVWTEDRHYEAWSYSVPGSVSLDVRPGGRWQATVAGSDGQGFPLTGTYIDVVEHERLDMGMDAPGGQEIMALALTDLGQGRTRLEVSQTCDTREGRDQAKEGSRMLLDSCAAYLATL